MKNKLIFTITFLSILFGLIYYFIFDIKETISDYKNKLNVADIKGIYIYYQGLPYSLNSSEQIKFIEMINRSEKFESSIKFNTNEEIESFEKIVILRFHHKDPLIIFPISYHNKYLIFTIPKWSQKYFFKEEISGEVEKFILTII